jgi:hypothetical protein
MKHEYEAVQDFNGHLHIMKIDGPFGARGNLSQSYS